MAAEGKGLLGVLRGGNWIYVQLTSAAGVSWHLSDTEYIVGIVEVGRLPVAVLGTRNQRQGNRGGKSESDTGGSGNRGCEGDEGVGGGCCVALGPPALCH